MVTILFCSIEKKKCWIHDGKHAYVVAEVKGRGNDGKLIVKTTDGKVNESLFPLWDNYILYLIK